MEIVVDFKKIAMAYTKAMLFIIRIQRAWRKKIYGPRKNWTKLFIQRQLSGKDKLKQEIKKRSPAVQPKWCWAEGLVINPW